MQGQRRVYQGGKELWCDGVSESFLIGGLEVTEESGVNDDVGMLGDLGVRMSLFGRGRFYRAR